MRRPLIFDLPAMQYWNKPNFEGLLRLSVELDAHPDLEPLASYCRFREQGLRRQAFSELERFLEASRAFDSATASAAAIDILESNARARGVHQFLAQPLVAGFLMPTLRKWQDEEPHSSLPVRWLGILSGDIELLAKALSMCPEDKPVRRLLIDHDLSCADYATHHLDETRFIGNIGEVMAALDHARSLMASAPDSEGLASLESELHYFDALIADWQAYMREPAGSFPEWCVKQGRKYGFPIKVYYKS